MLTYMHRVALIILYDRKKRFLLQHRTKDARILPDYWAFFGGEIEKGESTREAVKREALEELGYHLRWPHLVLEKKFQEGGHCGRLYIFIEYCNKYRPSFTLREGQAFGWYTVAQAADLKMVERDRQTIAFIDGYLANSKKRCIRNGRNKRNRKME